MSFSASTNRITSSGYSYDAAGNLLTDSSNLSAHAYQWDAEGRVASVDGGNTWSFTYNALGQRVQWAYPGGADQHFFDPEGTWLGNAGEYSLVRFGQRPLVVYEGSGTDFIPVNSIGSTSMFSNQTGNVVEGTLFFPWGDVASTAGAGAAASPSRDSRGQPSCLWKRSAA